MKKCLLFLITFFLYSAVFSQINYQKTLQQTFAKAKIEGKPIFICIMPSRFIYHAWFMCGLKKKEVIEYYNKTFVSYLGYETNKSTMTEINKYPLIKGSPHNLYLDSDANLVYQSFGIYVDASAYMIFADSVTRKIRLRNN